MDRTIVARQTRRGDTPRDEVPRPLSANRLVLLAGLLMAAASSLGCNAETDPATAAATAAAALSDLAKTRQSGDSQLHDALARVEAQRGLPRQLTTTPPPPEKNAAAVLEDLLDRQQVAAWRREAEALLPSTEFEFSALAIDRVVSYRDRHQGALRAARVGLSRPQCDFGIQFQHGYHLDRTFVDTVAVVVLLEALDAACQLYDDRPQDVVANLGAMFRWLGHLGAAPHVESRLTAGELRDVTYRVAAAVMAHPKCDRATVVRCQRLVDEVLAAWPDDQRAWIGDRAQALHAYELIRSGGIMDLLTPEELEQFSTERVLDGLAARMERNVDHDERFYMAAMREIIQSCQQPYYERRSLFTRLRRQLHAQRNAPEFPFAAARLFLPDVEKGHQIQAQDRARTEMWAIALALALGQERPPYRVNPYTGMPYVETHVPSQVTVWSGRREDPPVSVPILANTPPAP